MKGILFTILFIQKRANFRAENDIFRFLSTVFKNVNFFPLFGGSPIITTSIIFKKNLLFQTIFSKIIMPAVLLLKPEIAGHLPL